MAKVFRALRVSLNHRPAGRCTSHVWRWYVEF